jgi:glutamate/tyrosine decarboxylase-like PLP-dependent enzyme
LPAPGGCWSSHRTSCAGFQPLFVAAAAGVTNAGAVDPLPELADVCRRRGGWLHVDAACRGLLPP